MTSSSLLAMPAGDRPLRLLFLCHYGGRCGAARSLQLLVAELRRRGHEVLIATPPGDLCQDYQRLGLPFREIGQPGYLISTYGAELRGPRLIAGLLQYLLAFRGQARLTSLLAEFRPDIVHCNEFGMFHTVRVARAQGIPVVIHARIPLSPRPRWYHRWARRQVARSAARLIAIDGSVARTLDGIAKAEVVYNPFDPGPAQAPAPARVDEAVHVCFLCGLMRLKGLWDLLEAARLIKQRRDIVIDIYGGNSRSSAFLRSLSGRLLQATGLVEDCENNAKNFISQHGLANVRLHGHTIDVVKALRGSDILVFPSHLNGPGRSVFEAGFFAIPSIVAMRDRVEDIVEHESNGLIVEERNPQQLAAAILRLADDSLLRRRLGEAAQATFREKFTVQAVADGVLRVYRDILATTR